jgi:hypothetical protein
MFYSPRYREQYVVDSYLCAGNAADEADSMFNKGVFFGEPAGGPEEQKQVLQNYYRFLLTEHAGWYRRLAGRDPDSLFEAGSSVGWYMKVARDEFVNKAGPPLVQGCDANTYSAERARNGFGLDVRDGTFQQYPMTESQRGRFSLAAMLDYIEHSYAPCRDLAKMAEMMAPHGVLILKTFLHELDEKGAYVHPIFHAHHFTAATLRRSIESAGWTILDFDMQRERSLALVTVFAEKRA